MTPQSFREDVSNIRRSGASPHERVDALCGVVLELGEELFSRLEELQKNSHPPVDIREVVRQEIRDSAPRFGEDA